MKKSQGGVAQPLEFPFHDSDLMVIIKTMIGKSNYEGYKLKSVITRIKYETSSFGRAFFFHTRRDLNKEADQWTK
jgi:hypothetical protein